jgi:hypothetical protein
MTTLEVAGGVESDFVVNAWDNDTLDNGSLKITWDFGDGTVVGNAAKALRHTYPNPSRSVTYQVQVWAEDSWVDDFARSHNVTKSWDVTVTYNPLLPVEEYYMDLVTGWNFVTVPSVGYGYMASMLGVDQVAGYDPITMVYNVWWSLFPEENDFAIDGSTGYWVYANAPMTLTLRGDIPTAPQSRTITVPGGGGWAIVGFNSLNTTWTASDVVGMYAPGAVDQVASWDPIAETYNVWWSLFPEENDFSLAPGQAYWVYLTASGELTYTP